MVIDKRLAFMLKMANNISALETENQRTEALASLPIEVKTAVSIMVNNLVRKRQSA